VAFVDIINVTAEVRKMAAAEICRSACCSIQTQRRTAVPERAMEALACPAAVVRFARASRGSDPIRPASQSVLLERPLQASAKSLSRKEFVSCLIQNGWQDDPGERR
jgi:hypothetical protein